MGVVTVSSSPTQTPFGLNTRFSTHPSLNRRITILAFKADKTKNTALGSPKEPASLSVETAKENPKRLRRNRKPSERVQALSTSEAPSCSSDLDYNEAAAELDRIYKLSPTSIDLTEDNNTKVKQAHRRRKKIDDSDEKSDVTVVRSRGKKLQRLSLQKRINLKNKKDVTSTRNKHGEEDEGEKTNSLVREYLTSTDTVILDWKRMKIPPVLPSSEHTRLFKLLQPMKAILSVKEELQNDLQREPTDGELAEATNMNVAELRKHMDVGRAARNKLIKHNLRLVLFVMKKYFQEFANGPKFQDLCQAGAKGLIIAIDRFEPGRKLRLSTYSLFWIRHAIIRSMTVSSFTKVSFGLESVRAEIQRAKKEVWFKHDRLATEEEIINKVGISPARYREVMKASKPILSLHARNAITQEEFIKGIVIIADHDSLGRDKRRQPALLRLALDDVLDSLKPKESLVIRQRYGLDGRGNRTLGEVAGNLNISREMVRKHEVKALMKLKHPTRVDYLRRYIL